MDMTPWEPLDVRRTLYYGVFQSDGDSPDPLAIFPTEEEAVEWRHKYCTKNGCSSAHYCVMAIRNLAGEAWNSIEPPDV